jgi:hypothetical protein
MANLFTRKENGNYYISASHDIACNMSSLLSPIADLLQASRIDDGDLDNVEKSFYEVEEALRNFRETLQPLIEKYNP